MAAPTNRFILKFNTNTGRVARVSIPRADMTKTAAEVDASMRALAANGRLLINGKSLTTPSGAKTVTTERREIALPVAD